MTTRTKRMRALLTAAEIETFNYWAEPNLVARMTPPESPPCGGFLVNIGEMWLETAKRRIFIRIDHQMIRCRRVPREFCSQVETYFSNCHHPREHWQSTAYGFYEEGWYIPIYDGPYSFAEREPPHCYFLNTDARTPTFWQYPSAAKRLNLAIEIYLLHKVPIAKTQSCCVGIPRRSLKRHCQSMTHIANLYGTPLNALRRRLYEIRACLVESPGGIEWIIANKLAFELDQIRYRYKFVIDFRRI